MLRIIQPYELRDYLRTAPGDMGYMTPVAPNNRPLQWQGAYSENISIVYFIARKINNIGYVETSYDIETTCITYANGQYLIDETKLFDGILPEGYYYFEFNNGINSFFTELFCVKNLCQLIRCSSSQLCSSSTLIGESCVKNPNVIVLRQFETETDYYIFEN